MNAVEIEQAISELAEQPFDAHGGGRVGDVAHHAQFEPAAVAQALGASNFQPNEEVDLLKWFTPQDAISTATHESDKEMVERFLEIEEPTDTLIILRHTKALERGDWDGDDSLRTLNDPVSPALFITR